MEKITPRFNDLTGQRFTRWSVLRRAENNAGGTTQWLCRCSCGTERVVRGTELRYGASGSCGCLNKEISRDVCIRRNTTHSMSDTLTYGIWQNMKARCYEPKTSGYARYGGRGITICDRWRESFENFFADMGECPKGLSIERRANNGNYEPDNCHWASKRAQANNRSSNRPLTFNGKTQNCAEWAREIGIRPQELYKRLKRGLPLDRVLTKHLR